MSSARLDKLEPLVLGGLVFAATGGLGLLVPEVEGLSRSAFAGARLGWSALILASVVPFLAVACGLLGGRRRLALGLVLAWPLSVGLNLALDQDPLCAATNYGLIPVAREARRDYRSWQVVGALDEAETLCREPERGFYVFSGS